MKYSIFTVVLPEFDVSTAARTMKEWGYDGVEWRLANVPSPMPPIPNYWSANKATVDFARLPVAAREAKQASDDAGLAIPALASYVGCSDLDAVKKAMEAAAIMGAPIVRIGVPGYDGKTNYRVLFARAQDDYSRVADLARQHNLRACIEIHMGNICSSPSLALRLVGGFDPRYIGVILDPGNMIYEGYEDWRMGMELLGPYLAHVHLKNTQWQPVGKRPTGEVEWRASAAAAKSSQVHSAVG